MRYFSFLISLMAASFLSLAQTHAQEIVHDSEFYILQAPDVAIAEAGIGAGLTTAIYIVAIRGTTRWEEVSG